MASRHIHVIDIGVDDPDRGTALRRSGAARLDYGYLPAAIGELTVYGHTEHRA